MTLQAKYGSDLVVGDVLNVLGESWSITSITPYPNPHLFSFMDDRWTIIHSGPRGITCDPDHLYALTDDGSWSPAHHVDRDHGLPVLRKRGA